MVEWILSGLDAMATRWQVIRVRFAGDRLPTGNHSGLAWLSGSCLAWVPWLHVGKLSGVRRAGDRLPTGNPSGMA